MFGFWKVRILIIFRTSGPNVMSGRALLMLWNTFILKVSWNYGVRNREGTSEKTVSTSTLEKLKSLIFLQENKSLPPM